MKKTIFLCLLMAISLTISAKKTVVFVESFTYASSIGEVQSTFVRNYILSSLTPYPHLDVVDVESQASLNREHARRNSEDAYEDETARIGKMKQLGANYLIQGYISVYHVDKEVNGKGKESYKAHLTYTIKVVDCENGTLISSDVFSHDGTKQKSKEKANQQVLSKINKSMNKVVNKNFTIQSHIFDADYTIKEVMGKEVIKDCYIAVGSNDGLLEGTEFIIRKPVIKAGKQTYTDIGELKVISIDGEDISHCVVTKGGAETKLAMEEYISLKDSDPENAQPLQVISSMIKIK